MMCGKGRDGKRSLSPRTRRKSACCFFTLTSITIRACVTMGLCWVMVAVGVVCVCVSMCLCDRDCVHFSLGGRWGPRCIGLGWDVPLSDACTCGWVTGMIARRENGMKGEETAERCQTWRELNNPSPLSGAAATASACSQIHLRLGPSDKTPLLWQEAGHTSLLCLYLTKEIWEMTKIWLTLSTKIKKSSWNTFETIQKLMNVKTMQLIRITKNCLNML